VASGGRIDFGFQIAGVAPEEEQFDVIGAQDDHAEGVGVSVIDFK
jgi:hypothetical protein